MVSDDAIKCFKMNENFWKILGIHPNLSGRYYYVYGKTFIFVFVIFYNILFTINFYFLPSQLDHFIGEMVFYFTELGVASKVLTFVFMKKKISKILEILDSDLFKSDETCQRIFADANKFNIRYWRIFAIVSYLANFSHVIYPFIAHLIFQITLELPVCSYSFLSENTTRKFIYPFYFYQSIGMHFHMLYNVNIDTFLVGLMILVIAQLDVIAYNMRKITDIPLSFGDKSSQEIHLILSKRKLTERMAINNLNKTLIHYNDVTKFCQLIEEVFSVSLFAQFSVASGVICVCLFRFTLPAPTAYYVFLASYMIVMILPILVPCWFGTRIMDKSCYLSQAIYSSDWTEQSRRFKSSLKLFVERANRPLSITGWKMFPLSLSTFTSIMNSSYSFFTLLRHMQSRQT